MKENITIEQAIEKVNYYKSEYELLSVYVKHQRKEITKLKSEITKLNKTIKELQEKNDNQGKMF